MSEKAEETIALPKAMVESLLLQPFQEMKRQRRSRILSYVLKGALAIAFVGLAYFLGEGKVGFSQGDKHKPHVAFVEVYGPIMSGQLADADRLIPAIDQAFEEPLAKAVVLRINSPGGSPVHAGRMYDEIKQLRKQHPDKHVYAVIEDLGASAAYYIASAADKIYVDKASLVGSIGVISEGFGYDRIMEKVGIDRRVMTSGAHKALLDPYLPTDPQVESYWKQMLGEIHKQFISAVEDGRGERLHKDYPDLFSGLVWTGSKSIEIGLADSLGSLTSVSRDTVGEVNAVNYTPSPDFLKQLASQTHAQLASLKYELMTPTLY